MCNALEVTLEAETLAELGSTATIACSYSTMDGVAPEGVVMKWYKQATGGDRQRVMIISGLGTGEVVANLDGAYSGRPLSNDDQGSLVVSVTVH